MVDLNGKVVLDTKYGSSGERIPLNEPGTHGFSALATPNGFNSTVIVRVHDAAGKELMRSATRTYGPVTYYVPPRAAVTASFLVYSCLLREVKLRRFGDEDAITNIRRADPRNAGRHRRQRPQPNMQGPRRVSPAFSFLFGTRRQNDTPSPDPLIGCLPHRGPPCLGRLGVRQLDLNAETIRGSHKERA